MHEMGIILEIINITLASVPQNLKKCKIKKINLKIGKLSNVSQENLKFCFEMMSKETNMLNTKLSIESVPVIIKCEKCFTKSNINKPIFKCKKCNSTSLKILSGKELDITSIEIEDEE